jgi:hypothetical protein
MSSEKETITPSGMLREATQGLCHHQPALRLVPEHGVGRLRRWFVFFCRAVRDTGVRVL